jgi:hypothetical protein
MPHCYTVMTLPAVPSAARPSTARRALCLKRMLELHKCQDLRRRVVSASSDPGSGKPSVHGLGRARRPRVRRVALYLPICRWPL